MEHGLQVFPDAAASSCLTENSQLGSCLEQAGAPQGVGPFRRWLLVVFLLARLGVIVLGLVLGLRLGHALLLGGCHHPGKAAAAMGDTAPGSPSWGSAGVMAEHLGIQVLDEEFKPEVDILGKAFWGTELREGQEVAGLSLEVASGVPSAGCCRKVCCLQVEGHLGKVTPPCVVRLEALCFLLQQGKVPQAGDEGLEELDGVLHEHEVEGLLQPLNHPLLQAAILSAQVAHLLHKGVEGRQQGGGKLGQVLPVGLVLEILWQG